METRPADFSCQVLGPVVPQLRPRRVNKGNRPSMADVPKVANYKAEVRLAMSMCRRWPEPYDGPVVVDISVFIMKPKSWPKHRVHADTKPDVDNYAKLICDCMEGIIYTNDSRIVRLSISKYLDTNPRVEVRLWKLE